MKIDLNRMDVNTILFLIERRRDLLMSSQSPYIAVQSQEACKAAELTDLAMLEQKLKDIK